jgi:hypothetical protein
VHEQPLLAAIRIHPIMQDALNRMAKPLDTSSRDIAFMHELNCAHTLQTVNCHGTELLARAGSTSRKAPNADTGLLTDPA